MFLLLTNFLFVSNSYSQQFKKLEHYYATYQYELAQKAILEIDSAKLSLANKAKFFLLSGKIYSKLNRADLSNQQFLKSKDYYNKLDSIDKAQEINLELASLVSSQANNTNYTQHYIDSYLQYATKTKNPHYLAKAYKQLATMKVRTDVPQSILLFKKALKYNEIAKDSLLFSQIYGNLGVVHNVFLNQPNLGLYYLNQAIRYDLKMDVANTICYNYINQASSYTYLGDFSKAIEYLQKAEKAPIREYKKKTNSIIYLNLSRNYDSIHDYNNAYINLQKHLIYKDSLNEQQQNIAINDIQTQYDVKEKELKNLKLKNIIYTILGILFISLLLIYFTIKNSRKKEKIAKQDKELQSERYEKALKEHELESIESMLQGQDKERTKIANDLHDNLGSMLATLKLNFQNIKQRRDFIKVEEDLLFDKTDALLEEAYQKVRTIAHTKNAGVIASEGLVPAIFNIAKKVSIPDKFIVQVIPFGMDERLENTFEVSVFRMVQELLTNIIKHADATQATIHLTQHSDGLNIIIEDNGKGFDPETIDRSDGMGLANIEKKVVHMGGTFTIDSYPSKGTTILIDLPI